MKGFMFGNRSVGVLATVHPSMQRLARLALELSTIDFAVVQGKRTIATQRAIYGQSRTYATLIAKGFSPADARRYARPDLPRVTGTMNSDHLSGKAIDVMPWVNGKGDWDDDNSTGAWTEIPRAFKAAAKQLGIPMEWGGDWVSTKDRPHFSLK